MMKKNDKFPGRRLSRLLFFHFLREFLTPLLCCLGGFLTLFVVLDLVDVLSDFLGAKAGALAMCKYLLLVSPKQILFTVLPMSVLLAASFMVVTMTRHEEVTALRASGISLFACGLPLWLLAGGLSALTLLLNYYPLASRWAAEGETMLDMLGQTAADRREPGRKVAFWSPDGTRQWVVGNYREYGPKNEAWVWQFAKAEAGAPLQWLLYAAGTDYHAGEGWSFEDRSVATPVWPAWARADAKEREALFAKPVVACIDGEGGRRTLMVAEELRRDPQSGQWIFERGQAEVYDAQGRLVSTERFPDRIHAWTPPPEALGFDFAAPAEANVQFAAAAGRPACAFWAAGLGEINVPEARLEYRQALQVAYAPGGRPARLVFSRSLFATPGIRLVEYRQQGRLEAEVQEAGEEIGHLWASRLACRQGQDGQWQWRYENGIDWKGILPTRIGLRRQGTVACLPGGGGLPETPDNIINAKMKEMLCIQDLRRILDVNVRLPRDTRQEYLTMAWNRTITSLMPLVAALVGVAFSLVGQRRNPAVGFAWAMAVMVGYYMVDQALVLAGNANLLPPVIAGGGATAIFLALAIGFMWRRQ